MPPDCVTSPASVSAVNAFRLSVISEDARVTVPAVVVAVAAVNPTVRFTPARVPAVVVADAAVSGGPTCGPTVPAVVVLLAAVNGTDSAGVTVPAVVVADTAGTA